MTQINRNSCRFQPISRFHGEAGIYLMPAARFIGILHHHLPGTSGHKLLEAFIHTVFQSDLWKDAVLQLPNKLFEEPADFTCEYVAETDSFSFIVGVFVPEGTSVPEKLEYRDVPATLVWISRKQNGQAREIPAGYEVNFSSPGFPWQAFLRGDTYAVLPIKEKSC